MVARAGQEVKRERIRARREKIDKTTNKYMVILAWGIFTIIMLRFVESGYSSVNTVLMMPGLMKTLTVIFAIVGVGLFACSKLNILGHSKRFFDYGILAILFALGSLWIGFFSPIRNFFVELNPALAGIDSRWWISRGPITLVALYLVISLIWTTIKIARIEKGKKL